MNRVKKNIFIFLLCSITFGFTQTKAEKTLVDILKTIETKFDVKFSYADKTVKRFSIIPPNTDLNLSETLRYLELKTTLDFKILSERFIAIGKTKQINTNFKTQRLDEVFVQSYLAKGLSKSLNGSINISPQKFEILPGLSEPDILQTIQALPGIISADERISNINIRGGTTDQNLILYNGIRMYQSSHFFGLISAFNPYLVKNVNITVNGTNAKYGSGVSGLITIENSDEIDTKAKHGLGLNLISVDGFSKFQLSKKVEFQIAARRSYTDALSTPTYDSYFERVFNISTLGENQTVTSQLQQNDRFFFYDLSTKFLYDINKSTKIRANILSIFNQLDYNVESTTENQNASKSKLSQKSFASNINFIKNWNAFTMDAQIYFSNYKLSGNNTVINNNLNLEQKNEVADIGISVDFFKKIDSNLNLNFGYQFNEIGVLNAEENSQPQFIRSLKEVIKTHGIYNEIEYISKSKNTYGRFGLRGNYISEFNTFLLEPRFTLSQKFLDNFRLEFLGEIKNQSITQIIDLQQNFFGIEKRRWRLSDNKNVPIVKSNQLSLGLNYRNNGWLISAEAYLKNVTDISTRSQGFQNQYELTDAIGNYNIKGIDFLLNKKFKNLSTWLSYSHSKNNFEFDSLNNGQAFLNNLDIRHVINISSAYNLGDLQLSAGINWHSGRPFTTPSELQLNSGRINFNSPNAERLQNYLRTDVSARYDFEMSKNVNAKVGLNILNIFNTKNSINTFYNRDANNDIIKNNETALALTPNFSFRLNF